MKIEKLDVSNKKVKVAFILGIILTATIFILINYLTSKASYRNTESIDLAKGTITYKVPDLNVLALSVQTAKDSKTYDTVDEIPKGNYEINKEKSYCLYTNDTNKHKDIPMEYKDGTVSVSISKKGTKCYVFLDYAKTKKVQTALGELTVNLDTPNFRKTACDNGTNDETHSSGNCDSQDKGIYEAKDDYGPSYYYRGTVNNNWVQFGGYWWRIIRINGNGTVRMIYSGEIGNGTQPSEDDGRWVPKNNSQLSSTSKFNPLSNDNTFVGWRIGTAPSNSYNDAHSNTTNSTILDAIIKWYDTDSKLSATDKAKIDGATGFCNDRTSYPFNDLTSSSQPDTSQYGFGSTSTYYGAYFRLNQIKQPTYECPQASQDLFTTEGNTGNGVGQVPVGLITADEVMYAGAGKILISSNYGYWLCTENHYWTMSPYSFKGYAVVFNFGTFGQLHGVYNVETMSGVRPVINLKSTTKFSGTGIVSDPYIPSLNN